MPTIIQGEPGTQSFDDPNKTYDYEYPEGLDLSPTSELSKKLVNKILERARTSQNYMSRRHKSWNKIDETLSVYTPLDEEELKSVAKDDRKPVSIVFPYSHAILESLISYMLAAFYQTPVFEYEGHGPEDVIGATLMTKAVDLHCTRTKVALALHTMFRDAFAYGLGITVASWKTEHGLVYRKQKKGFLSAISGGFRQTGEAKVEEEALLFEGNYLINIDPYKALLDPNVPIQNFQESEFFGWVENTNKMTILSEEASSDEDIFNARYLNHMRNARTAIMDRDSSKREVRFGGKPDDNSSSTNPVDRIHMYVNLIPKEWKLGDSEYPEKWYFQVAGDGLLLQVKRLGLGHNKYPAAVCAPDYDGYSTSPISRLEMLFGLQGTLDWLFNVHIANVRKAVNDMFVYDPYMINSRDLENPHNGWLIRTRRPVWGKGVKDAIQQLNVNDITRQNIGDSSWVVQWMQKIGSTDGSIMGDMRQGGPDRLTGAEYQGTKQGGLNRLERMAKIIGLQAMQDIGYFFA